jgi:hypothetical protein
MPPARRLVAKAIRIGKKRPTPTTRPIARSFGSKTASAALRTQNITSRRSATIAPPITIALSDGRALVTDVTTRRYKPRDVGSIRRRLQSYGDDDVNFITPTPPP